MNKYKWHGEPVEVVFGYQHIKTNKGKPLFWYNYDCRENGEAIIEAVMIIPKDGEPFIISNQFGYAMPKLLAGGWPNMGHSGFTGGTFVPNEKAKIEKFNEKAYYINEAEREAWQRANFPDDFELRQKLLRSMFKMKKLNQ